VFVTFRDPEVLRHWIVDGTRATASGAAKMLGNVQLSFP
jgi:hypothetical protein